MSLKYLFINPITPLPSQIPIPGLPVLVSLVRNTGAQSDYIDLNSEVNQNFTYTKDGIISILSLFDKIYEGKNHSKAINDCLDENTYQSTKKYLLAEIDKIDFYKKILTDKKLFCNRILYKKAAKYFTTLRKLLFIFEDNLHSQFDVNDCNQVINIELIEEYLNLGIYELLYKNIEDKLDKIIDKDTVCVGISVVSGINFQSALYLCKILHNRYNVHINLGGNYGRYIIEAKNANELFSKYFDSVSFDENYNTVTDIISYFRGEKEISEIANFAYMQNNEIKINKSNKKYRFDKLPMPDYSNFSKKQYLAPELIMPIHSSNGCYWGKCIFCECTIDKTYQTKSPQKIIDEIIYTKEVSGSKYFHFWDNSVHPNRMNQLADLIIEKKLDIKYSIYARLEDGFTKELLEKMYKSGCCMINWGLDAASEHVSKYINKGININNAPQIIKNSADAGISNVVYLILGHPTEDINDLKTDLEFIENNKNNILFVFALNLIYIPNTTLTKNKDNNLEQTYTTEKERNYFIKLLQSYNTRTWNITLYDSLTTLFLRSAYGLYSGKYAVYYEKLFSYALKSNILSHLITNIYYWIYKSKNK